MLWRQTNMGKYLGKENKKYHRSVGLGLRLGLGPDGVYFLQYTSLLHDSLEVWATPLF